MGKPDGPSVTVFRPILHGLTALGLNWRSLCESCGIEPDLLDFLVHLPLNESKLAYFRQTRERFSINPACCFACGDEAKDYRAAVSAGMHPFMVSYGFEDFERLHEKHEIPAEVISRSPDELAWRVLHALNLDQAKGSPSPRPSGKSPTTR